MLLHAAQTAAACLEDVRAPVTVVHGDFVPWNIVLDNTLPRVFDWEWASLEGVPGWDAVYFPLQVGQVVERWSAPELVACVKRLADRPVHPYGGQQYRCLILLVLVHLAKVVAGTPPFALTVRQAIEHLLKAAWLSDTTPRPAS